MVILRCPFCGCPDIDSKPDGIHMYCKECRKEWDEVNRHAKEKY